MIITRTPFRISFAGGGTDLRSFYVAEPGRVISASINKFIYVVIKRQIGIVEHKYRINWSKVEFTNSIDEIEHPIVREALKLFHIDFPIEITTFTDVPGQTGLGSSSAFAVGLVHALHALKGEMVTKHTLAKEAAFIEVDLLERIMGKQDHYASAYGNINVFTFTKDEVVKVDPVLYRPEILKKVESNLLLFYLRTKRNASEILRSQDANTEVCRENLRNLQRLVDPIRDVFNGTLELDKLGEILDEGWQIKRKLSNDVSSSEIDDYYYKAMSAGALGGKVLGAGGGGFLLFYVKEDKQLAVKKALSNLFQMPVLFDNAGSRITYYDGSMV